MARHRSTAAAFAAAALLAAGLAACGEDAEQISAQELISEGDAICAQGAKKFDRVQSESPPTAAVAAEQTNELVGIATDELNELRRIRPPQELRKPYDAYLQARGRALELLEEGRDAAEDGDGKAYGIAQEKAAAEQGHRQKLAAAVGFKACSKS